VKDALVEQALPRKPVSRFLRPALLGVGIIALVLAGRSLAALVPAAVEYVRSLGPLAPIGFVVLYAVATVAFVPGSVLTLAAGAIFGLGWGIVIVMVSAILGESGAFFLARYGIRGLVAKRLGTSPRFAGLDEALRAEGRKIVFLLRLSPLIPFNALNYLLGISRVRYADFLIASVGMLPGTALYVYYGKVAGDVATLAAGAAPAKGAGYYVLLAAGLVATIVVTAIITRAARRALAAATPELPR
jgi:uncharacterized membrane protein YdjX (TVP38/TMEM64 family)